MSAPSPRPKAFLGIGDDLLGELRVALRPFTVYVIENNWLTKTRRLGEPHIAGNHALKDLGSEEAPQVGGYLARERGSLVVHRQEDAFDFEARIQRTPDTH